MFFLFLAVLCSLIAGIIFKLANRYSIDVPGVIASNYLAATLLALLMVLLRTEGAIPEMTPHFAALGVFSGGLFIGTFYILSAAIRQAGMSAAIAVQRISVVLPFLASWLIWQEEPNGLQLFGMVLAALSFILISQSPPAPGSAVYTGGMFGASVTLAMLFVIGGLVDIVLKYYREVFYHTYGRELFLLVVFGTALVAGLGIVLHRWYRRRVNPRWTALGMGLLLGLVNFYSAEFFLRAIRTIPGTVVFPVHNIALVIGAAIIGVLVWRERLSGANILGLGVAAMALFLLW